MAKRQLFFLGETPKNFVRFSVSDCLYVRKFILSFLKLLITGAAYISRIRFSATTKKTRIVVLNFLRILPKIWGET